MSLMAKMSERGIIQSNMHIILTELHHVPKLYARYHDLSSSGSPDIVSTRVLYYTKCQSEKGHNSVKYVQNFANR